MNAGILLYVLVWLVVYLNTKLKLITRLLQSKNNQNKIVH